MENIEISFNPTEQNLYEIRSPLAIYDAFSFSIGLSPASIWRFTIFPRRGQSSMVISGTKPSQAQNARL